MSKPKFIRRPLDGDIGLRSGFAIAVDAVCEKHPQLEIGEAMQCVRLVDLEPRINWGLAVDLERRRKAYAPPQERRATTAPDRRSKNNGFASETKFRAAALAELRKIPRTKWWKCNTGKRGHVAFGDKGAPDIMGILPGGRFVGVECKHGKGATSDDQDEWHRQAIELGALVIVAWTMDEVIGGVLGALR